MRGSCLSVREQANMGMTGEVIGSADRPVFPYLVTVSRRGTRRLNPAQPSKSAQTTGCFSRVIRSGVSTPRRYPAANTQNPSIQAINGQFQHRIRGGENGIRGGVNALGRSFDLTRLVNPPLIAKHRSNKQH